MISYTETEFLLKIRDDKKINFLAEAITPLHALGINAAMLQLQEEGIKLRGYIICVAHRETGSAIDETNFHTEKSSEIEVIKIILQNNKKKYWYKISAKIRYYAYYFGRISDYEEKLYWITPMKPSYNLIPKVASNLQSRKIQAIVTDEGLGGYLDSKITWWSEQSKKGNIVQKFRAAWTIFIEEPILLKRMSRRGEVQYSRLLVGKHNDWNTNEKVISYYRKVMQMKQIDEDFSDYSGALLINTDTLYESGRLKTSEDVDIYMNICNKMEQHKIKSILKMHPREKQKSRYTKIQCIVEPKAKVAQETILANLQKKPLCVVGIASTTLVNAKILFGVDAISINKLIDREQLKSQDFYRRFNKTFSNLIYIPSSMDELDKILDEIIQKDR